ncbi:MAG: MFS transporter [Myxococcota bacterium]
MESPESLPEGEKRASWRAAGGPLAAFRVPHFLAYWLSNLLQFFSAQIHSMTMQWLVTELTTSRTLLGLVGFVQGTVVAAASPLAGVAADRFAKRHLLVASRVAMAGVVLLMAFLVQTGLIVIWHIIALAVVGGLIMALMQPASQTYVFDIVGRERIQNAIALNSTGTGAAQMLGPALAGGLIAAVGIVGAFVSAAAGILLATGMLALIPVLGSPTSAGRGRALRELRDGFGYVRAHPALLLTLVACSMAIFNGALFAMRPIFARHVLEVGSVGYGMMAGASGVGTVVGALVATLLPPFRRPGVMITLAMFGYSTCIFLYSFAFSFEYVLVVEFGTGLFGQLWNVSTFSGLQMAVPENMRGRIVSMVFMVVQLASIGQLFVGALADAIGDQLAMGIFGLTPMLVLGGILAFGHRTLREL